MLNGAIKLYKFTHNTEKVFVFAILDIYENKEGFKSPKGIIPSIKGYL